MKEPDKSEEERWARGQQALTCPLLSMRPETLDDSVRRLVKSSRPNDCLHQDCAWWGSEAGQCAVLTLAQSIKAQTLS